LKFPRQVIFQSRVRIEDRRAQQGGLIRKYAGQNHRARPVERQAGSPDRAAESPGPQVVLHARLRPDLKCRAGVASRYEQGTKLRGVRDAIARGLHEPEIHQRKREARADPPRIGRAIPDADRPHALRETRIGRVGETLLGARRHRDQLESVS
jgi:hypothetical protein